MITREVFISIQRPRELAAPRARKNVTKWPRGNLQGVSRYILYAAW